MGVAANAIAATAGATNPPARPADAHTRPTPPQRLCAAACGGWRAAPRAQRKWPRGQGPPRLWRRPRVGPRRVPLHALPARPRRDRGEADAGLSRSPSPLGGVGATNVPRQRPTLRMRPRCPPAPHLVPSLASTPVAPLPPPPTAPCHPVGGRHCPPPRSPLALHTLSIFRLHGRRRRRSSPPPRASTLCTLPPPSCPFLPTPTRRPRVDRSALPCP